MAIDDFGGKVLGKPIELLTGPPEQGPTSLASKAAREWDRHAEPDDDLQRHQLGVAWRWPRLPREKKRVMINNGAGSPPDLTRHAPLYTVHYAYDNRRVVQGGSWRH